MLKFDKVNTIYLDGGGVSFIIYHSVVLHIHKICLGGFEKVGGTDIYMRGDFPQIGSFQGDKPQGVGNCVSRLFRQNHLAIKKIKIQMLAIKRFKAVVCLQYDLIWLIPMLDF